MTKVCPSSASPICTCANVECTGKSVVTRCVLCCLRGVHCCWRSARCLCAVVVTAVIVVAAVVVVPIVVVETTIFYFVCLGHGEFRCCGVLGYALAADGCGRRCCCFAAAPGSLNCRGVTSYGECTNILSCRRDCFPPASCYVVI